MCFRINICVHIFDFTTAHVSVWRLQAAHVVKTAYQKAVFSEAPEQFFPIQDVIIVGNYNCVLHHQWILLCHRHVLKQSATERSVLRRQKPGTVFRQKWRHQWHCWHLNRNLKLTFFFTVISRHVISPHIYVLWLQCFCICSLKFLIDWLNWSVTLIRDNAALWLINEYG